MSEDRASANGATPELLRALDDVLDPTQSDAGRDLSTRHLQQSVERECHALAEAS